MAQRTPRAFVVALGFLAYQGTSCSTDRASDVAPRVYDTDVAPIFQRRCVSCHGGATPAAGWSATSYLGAIACVPPLAPATLPADARAPLLTALAKPPHAGVVDATERATLEGWVANGSPARLPGVHAAGVVDPRSEAFHGTTLRAVRWAPMLAADDAKACGVCHEGTPADRPRGVALSAPGATACTSCHTEPGGALGCATCHGAGTKSYPPRDPCFFPGDAPAAGAHAAHVEPSAARAGGLPCSSCHPTPGADVIANLHGNGSVEVTFDPVLAGARGSYDRAAKTCTVGCHDRGGERPVPSWTDTAKVGCNGCHTSPPAGHFPGACSGCHREANATGTSLSPGPLHMNGRVDLGDGGGTCGACHGTGASPWPTTGAHPSHQTPTLTLPVACASCHVVPATIASPGHLDGRVEIVFGGHAVDRGANPLWSGASCSGVACHGAGIHGGPAVVPVWADASGSAGACGACHGLPPTEHTTSTSCERSTCHGAEVGRSAAGVLSITAAGLLLHIDGHIDVVR